MTLRLPDARTERLLGAAVPRADAAGILTALGFGVADADDGLDVTVPTWRRDDVTREADLIEEVARIWGLDRLPSTLPSRRGAVGRLAPEQRIRRRAEDALVGAGLSEAVGWSFTSPAVLAPARPATSDVVALENPMSEDQSVMRTTLLGSLLDALRRNRSRGFEDVRLFEAGSVYLPRASAGELATAPTGNPWYPANDPDLPVERTRIAALLTGHDRPPSWGDPEPPRADLFAAKGVLEALLARAARRLERRAGRRRAVPAPEPLGHRARRRDAGRLARRAAPVRRGRLGPRRAWPASSSTSACSPRRRPASRATRTSPRSPRSARTSRSWSPTTSPRRACWRSSAGAGGALLRDARVFDVYRGAQVGEGRASLALRLEFRAPDRTLTDEEVAQRRAKIVAALREQLGGELRG